MEVSNKILTRHATGDGFSAVDIMVLNLNTGAVNFIKLGATFTVIKSGDEPEIIEGNALPMGVVENVQPFVTRRVLSENDVAVLLSDGVTDVTTGGEIAEILDEERRINPEVLSSKILDAAVKNGASDDATVLTVKSFRAFNNIYLIKLLFFNADDSIILFVKEKIIQNVLEAAKNQRIAVGVSGGVDSMVLLRALIEAKKSTDFSFFIVNIEHGIRGRSSENDSRFVADFARSHGIECRTFKVDSLRRAKEFGETEEEAARVLRYGVFQKLLIDGDCDKVFLAHHEDDQAETVLMRIIRGTGIKGLSGMQKETRGYVRPLLDVSKEEILDFQKIRRAVRRGRNQFRKRQNPKFNTQ